MTVTDFIPEIVLTVLIIAIRAVGLSDDLPLLLGALYGALAGAFWCSMEVWSGNVSHSKLWTACSGGLGALACVAAYLVFGESFFSTGELAWPMMHREILWKAPMGAERDVIYASLFGSGITVLVLRVIDR